MTAARTASLLFLVVGSLVVAIVPLSARAVTGAVILQAQQGDASDSLEVVIDQQGAEIAITSPLEGSVVAGNAVTLTGTVQDRLSEFSFGQDGSPLFGALLYRVRDASGVTLLEGRTPLVDGRFSAPDVLLGSGEHGIELQVLDAAGQFGFAETTVTSDPDAPPVTLVDPQDGEALLVEAAELDLNFAAPTTLVSVNGVADGREFSAGLHPGAISVPLALGANPVTLALESEGRSFELSFTLFRVDAQAELRIREPVDGARLGTETVTVRGTAPLGTPLVEVNGVVAAMAGDGVSFTAAVPLDEGENTLRAIALPLGQRDLVEVTADFTPPGIFAVVPGDGSATADSTVDLVAFFDEGGSMRVEGPGGARSTPTRLDVDRSAPEFGLEVHRAQLESFPLELGENVLVLRAIDAAGNVTTESLTLTRRAAALALASPAAGTVLEGVRADVVLEAVEPVTIEAWHAAGRRLASFEEAELPVGPSAFVGLPLVPGENPMRIVYRRTGGPPEVLAFSFSSSADAASAGLATVQGTVTDGRTGTPLSGAIVTLRVGDDAIQVATDSDGRYTAMLPVGALEIEVSAEGFLVQASSATLEADTILVADAALTPWAAGSPADPGTPAEGEATTLAGVATDARSGEPLGGVLVQVATADGTFSAISAADGSFSVQGIPSGDLEVSASRVGYFPREAEITTSGTTTVTFDPALEPFEGAPASLPSEVAILVPPDGTVTDFEALTVVGTVSDPTARVTVNGVEAEVLGPRFTARGVPLAEGKNTLQAVASAPGAEPATAAVTVTRAAEPVLDVVLYSPPAGALVPGSGLVVRGFVSASDAIVAVSPGGAARAEEGVFAVMDVGFAPGESATNVTSAIEARAFRRETGEEVVDRREIDLQSAEPALSLRVDPVSGPIPLGAELELVPQASFDIVQVAFDVDGDDRPDHTDDAAPFDTLIATTLDVPRWMVARVFVTTRGGVELTAPQGLYAHLPAETLRSFAEGNPVDLASGPEGSVYVLDAAAGRVTRYSRDGEALESFGSSGSGTGQLLLPQALDVGPSGRVFVADTGNDRIQVFAADGGFERTIGELGELRAPRGLLAERDRLVVADAGNARVQVLEPGGKLLGSIPLSHPRGLARLSGFGHLVASPEEGLRAVRESGRSFRVGSPEVLRALPDQGVLAAPVDVAVGGEGVLVADASRAQVVLLNDSLLFRRVVAELDPPPRAVLAGSRRAVESLYVADGTRVREIGLPVPSPVPVMEALRDRLAAGDIEGALERIHPLRRTLFEGIYRAIEPDLPVDAAAMDRFRVDRLREDAAVVLIETLREEQDGTFVVETAYPAHLVRAEDGTWQILDY